MKTALSLWVALLVVSSVNAQVYRPHVRQANGGHVHRHGPSVAIGYSSGHRHPGHFSLRGHGYGRGPGYYHGVYRSPVLGYYPGYDYRHYPYANLGYYGSGYYGSGYVGYGTYAPGYYSSPGYYNPVYQGRGSGAAGGLLLGALAGGIIGHNSGEFRHNGWRGAAWGAGLGWLLGTVVDANRRPVSYQAHPAAGYGPQPVAQGYAAPAQAQPVTIINNYYNAPATPMSAANGLFGR